MTITTIELDGLSIEIIRKAIKNVHLRIYPPDGRVRVSVPLRLSMKHVHRQLEEKREWIHTQRARLQAMPARFSPLMESGETHLFLGLPYVLSLRESHRTQINIQGQQLQLCIKKNATSAEKYDALSNWYRAQMQLILPELIHKWEHIIGVEVTTWGVKIMKTRWGSCNTRARRIWLNLSLIKKPILCLESVIVHELVHLLEASHNARFYQLMDTLMPDWRVHQAFLRGGTD